MPLYEHVFMARQDISNAQVDTLTKDFAKVIEAGGGKVTKTEYWGLKGLAYKVKKSRKAHYTLLNIDAPSAAVVEMERQMGINADVLRYLTVRVEKHEAEPSVQMRKADRDERGRDDRGPGGFRGGDRGGFRGGPGGGGGFRGGDRPPREGGSTFRPRPEGDAGAGGPPRGPRPPRRDGGNFGSGA